MQTLSFARQLMPNFSRILIWPLLIPHRTPLLRRLKSHLSAHGLNIASQSVVVWKIPFSRAHQKDSLITSPLSPTLTSPPFPPPHFHFPVFQSHHHLFLWPTLDLSSGTWGSMRSQARFQTPLANYLAFGTCEAVPMRRNRIAHLCETPATNRYLFSPEYSIQCTPCIA